MSKNIVRVNKNDNYTVMSNHHLRNENLSWKAKGIHSYILSLPDDWKVIIEHLKKVSTDGRDSTRSGIQELYDLRYWQRYPVHIDGKIDHWVTEVFEEPFPKEDKIESIIIRDNIKTINYTNRNKEEIDLLTGNPRVVENTSVDLLTGNPQVGIPQVGNPELLSTNTTKDLSINNHSFIQEDKKKNDRMIERKHQKDKEKLEKIFINAELSEEYFKKNYKPLKKAIESLYYRNKPLVINNMSIPPSQIRKDLEELDFFHLEMGINIFNEESSNQIIRNRISYLAVCIYNSLFDMELKIQNYLRYQGLI